MLVRAGISEYAAQMGFLRAYDVVRQAAGNTDLHTQGLLIVVKEQNGAGVVLTASGQRRLPIGTGEATVERGKLPIEVRQPPIEIR